ncbi:YidC/Oxa1 family membrane protein insertase [Paenibacillus marinisediminis]
MLQPIIEVLHQIIQWCYAWTGDWAISIILLTLLVRLALFFLNLKLARTQLKQVQMRPELDLIRSKYSENKEKLMQETSKLYKHYGVGGSMWLSLLQMPIFFSLYHLFSQYGASMSSDLLPWIQSFSQPDPTHIMPTLYAICSFTVMMLPIVPQNNQTGTLLKRIGLPLAFTLFMLTIFWQYPVALCIYYTFNAFCNIGERIFYRTVMGNRLLNKGMPEPIFQA